MNSGPRDKILDRLNSGIEPGAPDAPTAEHPDIEKLGQNEKIEKLKGFMEAVRTEVHIVKAEDWMDRLKSILKSRELKTLLYAPETPIGDRLKKEWPAEDEDEELPQLVPYESDIEDFKDKLFHMDAAITSTVGGIAETGAIILWPNKKEPRLMSLVPPIHIAVLEAEKIHNTFCEAIQIENWPDKMPTNVVLVSGPSKTADIELTLAFGVHGPKELIVLIVENEYLNFS
jgi:L-lactate dehydrogenase complex protein LldG